MLLKWQFLLSKSVVWGRTVLGGFMSDVSWDSTPLARFNETRDPRLARLVLKKEVK